ncbi:hypothetical protein M8C21_007887, partial [Ambrosia artemisiifolia]
TSLLFFSFLLHAINRNRNQRLPPGPTGLPIIGNLLDLGPKPHESLAKLSKKHGPLMTIRLGSTTTVVASTPEAAREILQHNDEACSGRVVPDAVASSPDNDVAMAWIPANHEFRIMRKALSICLTNQHKLDTLRDLRQNVVEGMIDFLNDSGRKKANVDIGKLAFAVALNMMSNTCLSRNELFLAGTETSSNTTEWTMTELLLNPDMFSRVRKEVSTTVAEDGKIQEAKLLDLPYLQAVIKETMRLHLAVPLLVPHKSETEVKLGEYIVPKNTQIMVNAWAMARDPRYWENPMKFKPERFLENELEFKGQHFEFIPFGSGRRMCPGIPVAQRVVSLMVASFVYHCDWILPHAREEMDMEDIFGLTLFRATPLLASPIPVAQCA